MQHHAEPVASRPRSCRLIAFAAMVVVALAANWIWPRRAEAPAVFPPGNVFPLTVGGMTMTAMEPPSQRGRHELWASYRGATWTDQAYIAFSYGIQSFHDWIGCFLIEGPKPLWSGSLTVAQGGGSARFAATVLSQAGEVRAVAHSECWSGKWRGSEWQNRWFALWHTPGHPVPLINAYVVEPASSTSAPVRPLRGELQTLLEGLDWEQMNAVCRASGSAAAATARSH